MAAARPWTDADTARLRELHGQGKSLHQIAAEMDRSKSTISRHADRASLTWDRTSTATATQALVADNRARRAALVHRAYTRAEHVLDRLEAATFTTLVPCGPGQQEAQSLDFVPPQEERSLAQAVSTYLASAARLEAIDSDAGTDAAKAMLTDLFAAIRDAAGPAPDQ